MQPSVRRLARRTAVVLVGLALVALATRAWSAFRDFVGGTGRGALTAPGTAVTTSPGVAESLEVPLPLSDTLLGRSGALRFATLTAADANALPGFVARYGEEALRIERIPDVVFAVQSPPICRLGHRPVVSGARSHLDRQALDHDTPLRVARRRWQSRL